MGADEQAVFSASAHERRAVADLLGRLDERQLTTPSLCAGWDVRTVAAHLAAAVAAARWPFLVAALRHGGNVHRANDAVARQMARRPIAEVAALLRAHADSRFAPPLIGPRGPLTDVLVHAGDIRVPLGLPHEPAGGHVRIALEFVSAGRPIGFLPRGRLTGLRLVADDLGWSWGAGPELRGRGIEVLMAACGRAALLPALAGSGVEILGSRLGVGTGGTGD